MDKKLDLAYIFRGITKKSLMGNLLLAVIVSAFVFLFSRNVFTFLISFVFILVLVFMYIFMKVRLSESAKIQKMEDSFPDFLQLVSSNLRAGITIDQSIVLSARKEFDPLDKEIIKVGKELITGREIETSLLDMSNRINSEKIRKTINLLVSGIRSGGNIAVLLEETASNLRERAFVEKKSASNVLMYVIFIFAATAVGAPALFALSSVLVKILSDVLATIPVVDTSVSLPFTLTKISVSTTFITYYAFVFLVVTDILGSLVIGLVRGGREKDGVKYIVPLIVISLLVFFTMRYFLLRYFSGLF